MEGLGMRGGESAGLADGRRKYLPPPDQHMQELGVAATSPLRQGRGRRHLPDIEALEPGVLLGRQDAEAVRGRRFFAEEDQLKSQIFTPETTSEAPATRALTPAEMKMQLRQCLAEVHGMRVTDERKWSDVVVERNGFHWKVQAFTERGQLTGRDGPSAKFLADTLAMVALGELRHFGLSAPSQPATGGSRPASRAQKGSVSEVNPSFVSPGVQDAIYGDAEAERRWPSPPPAMSSARRDPEAMSRRYIHSGRDHWDGAQVGSHGALASARDLSFHDGLERGIGQGKRHLERKDNLFGGNVV